ncbi:MAG: M50 family metallopeptidase, partial [Egibacteraceae bacterium]
MRPLQLRLGGVGVQVDPSFLLMAVVLGYPRLQRPALLAVWVVVVFVSILVHEMGHAGAYRAFGLRPQVTLYAMGGVTTTTVGRGFGAGRQLVVSLAGPVTGFALGAVAWSVQRAV